MTEELKKCPFCDGEAEIKQYGDRTKSTIVGCTNCGCTLESGEESNHGSDWNTRTLEAENKRLRDNYKDILNNVRGYLENIDIILDCGDETDTNPLKSIKLVVIKALQKLSEVDK